MALQEARWLLRKKLFDIRSSPPVLEREKPMPPFSGTYDVAPFPFQGQEDYRRELMSIVGSEQGSLSYVYNVTTEADYLISGLRGDSVGLEPGTPYNLNLQSIKKTTNHPYEEGSSLNYKVAGENKN